MSEAQHGVTGLVLMHGAGLGGWIWRDVVPSLSAPAIAADFPARAAAADVRSRLTFDDYVAHLEAQVREFDVRRIVLVAHSIAGVLAPRLVRALGLRVVGLVAVAAVIPTGGGSFLSALPLARRVPMMALLRLGTRPPDGVIRKGQCNDLDAKTADEVVARFAPESRALFTARSGVELPTLPSLYIHTTADAELGLSLQRRMAATLGAAETAEIEAGHLPMLSRPAEVAGIVNRFTAQLGH